MAERVTRYRLMFERYIHLKNKLNRTIKTIKWLNCKHIFNTRILFRKYTKPICSVILLIFVFFSRRCLIYPNEFYCTWTEFYNNVIRCMHCMLSSESISLYLSSVFRILLYDFHGELLLRWRHD